jgi:hypothetical protein
MSTADKAKLDTVQAGAQPNPGPATTSAAGLMSTADKAKLDTVQAGAQPNPGPATTSAAGLMSTADKAKLDLTTPGSAGIPLVVRADENGAALYALYNGQDILLHVLSTDPYLPTDIVNFMVYRNGGSPGATLFWEIVASSLNYMSIAWGTNLLYKMSDVLTCDLEIPAGTTVTLTAYDFLGNVATATAVVLDHVPYPTRTAVSTTLLSRSVVSGYGIPAVSNGRYAIFPMVGTSAYPTAVEAVDHTLTKVTATPVSVGRQSYACARFKDRAFIGGGFINSNLNSSSVIDVYDARLVRTTPVTLSVARYYLAAAANDTHILFGGGQASSAGYIDPVDAFDANLVRTTATLSQGGRYLGAAANDTHVLFGGGEPASGSSYTDVVDAFDAALVRSNPTGLSLQRRYVSAARAGQYVVFAGGYTSSVSYSQRTVDAYDKQLTRHIPAEFVTAQAACCACSLFQRYAIFFPGYLTSSYVHVYDDMLVYTTTTNLSISTRHLRAAVVGKYVIVQDNESGNNSTHTEIYELT